MAAGQRPINNVVDITNYAMLLSGQPLHAFDLDRVAGRRLIVRRANDGEQVQTLDGQTRTLDSGMVVIDDAQGPTSIAGLMGGARSEVQPDTTSVLIEVATWHGPAIHRASWALGLRSEASSRFEKGLQPEQCMHAQAIAAQLMIELCGATLARGTIDVGAPPTPPQTIALRESRVQAILGVPIPRARQAQILHALDFATAETNEGLDVTVPPLRRDDVTREADLIEEVARMDGLEKLPATLPKRRNAYGLLTPVQRLGRRALDVLVGRGLYVRRRAAAFARAGRAQPGGCDRESAVGGSVAASHDAAGIAAGCGAAQRRARRERPAPVRARHCLQSAGADDRRTPLAGGAARRASCADWLERIGAAHG
jgi:phenylalanyl-tRNA synthetase beta chain